jgi:hypothetical protein
LAAAILIGSFLYFNGKEKPVNVWNEPVGSDSTVIKWWDVKDTSKDTKKVITENSFSWVINYWDKTFVDSVANWGAVPEWLFTEKEFKRICNDNVKNNRFCDDIKWDFYKNKYYWLCNTILTDDISFCSSIKSDSPKDQSICEISYYLNKAISEKKTASCNIFKDKYVEFKISQSGDNYDLCSEFVWLAQKFSDAASAKFNDKYFSWLNELDFTNAIINDDPKSCEKITWINEKIKCLAYTKTLRCDELDNPEYIFKIINNTNYFSKS